jgi:hypothetical protein
MNNWDCYSVAEAAEHIITKEYKDNIINDATSVSRYMTQLTAWLGNSIKNYHPLFLMAMVNARIKGDNE